jgi:hypothetical protein
LLPNVAGSQCTLNSTETDCLLKRINKLNDRISLLESKLGKNVINIRKLIISKDSMIYLVQLLLSFNQGQGKGIFSLKPRSFINKYTLYNV